MATKHQQTMSKIMREREVKERRARKLEKKHAAAAERKAKAEGATLPEATPPSSNFVNPSAGRGV
jgi:hypothetical protein